jgi:hypothetical protein
MYLIYNYTQMSLIQRHYFINNIRIVKMGSILHLPTEPQEYVIPRQTLLTAMILESAETDKQLLKALLTNPAEVMIAAGFPLQQKDASGFNDYCWNDSGISELFSHLNDGGEIDQLKGWKCSLCKMAAYTVAIIIAAIGTTALSTLTVTSGAVVALAAFVGVTAATALPFIVSLGAAITAGVTAIAAEICSWTGACD